MSNYGTIIFLIWIFSILAILLFNKPLRFLLKKDLFWKIFMFSWVAYFLAIRLIPDWINAAQGEYDEKRPTIFLTDFCAASGLFVPILTFFKKTRNIAMGFGLWMFIASNITGFEIFEAETKLPFWKWFLVSGEFSSGGANHFAYMHVSLHYFGMLIGCLLILNINIKKYNWKKYLALNNFGMIFYLLYVFGIKEIINLDHNVTGLAAADWKPGGEYAEVSVMFNLEFPYVFIVGYGLIAIGNWLLILLISKMVVFIIKHNESWDDLTSKRYYINDPIIWRKIFEFLFKENKLKKKRDIKIKYW